MIAHVSMSLDPGDKVYGVFRHGGRVGLTKATYDQPWVAELFVRGEVSGSRVFSGLHLREYVQRDPC